MSKLNIPYIEKTHSENLFVFSIEGSNGAGKTTLMNKYKELHGDTECILCVPEIFQTSKEMKRFMLFESSPLCGALYYLAGSVEMFHKYDGKHGKILFDRSIWSTFATAYSKNDSILPELFDCLQAIKHHVFLPNLIIVLDVSFETAKKRSEQKTVGGEFDKDEFEQFQKKKEFFIHLSKAGYDVIFLDTNQHSIDEVYKQFGEVVNKYFKGTY